MSSCQVGRTSWGWGGRRVRRMEFGAPLVSRWQTTLWRSPTAIDSLCSQSQVADCSLQPVSPLGLVGICSFLEAPTYLHQGSTAVWHLNLFVSCGDWILGINTELLTGMPFLYSSLQLHILEEKPLIRTSSLRKIMPVMSVNPGSCRSSRYICIRKMNHNNENTIPYQENGLANGIG